MFFLYSKNAGLELVTVNDSPHSFLVDDGDGVTRYTDQYWSRMADWLRQVAGNSRNAGQQAAQNSAEGLLIA